MSEKPWQDEERLREMYVEEEMSIYEIADELGCSNWAVRSYLDKFDIETKYRAGNRDRPWRDEDTLREMYVEKEMSAREIGDEFGCNKSTIFRWLEKCDITSRKNKLLRFTRHNFYGGYEICGDSLTEESVSIHRLVAVAEYGIEAVKDKHIHHRNHIKWDNRPENLRPVGDSKHTQLHHKHFGFDEDGWPIYANDYYDWEYWEDTDENSDDHEWTCLNDASTEAGD